VRWGTGDEAKVKRGAKAGERRAGREETGKGCETGEEGSKLVRSGREDLGARAGERKGMRGMMWIRKGEG